MSISAVKALIQIFVYGFYRVHAGILIFLFASVLSCCFFVNTLGELPPNTYFFWHFIITITMVSNPFMMMVFCVISLFYAFKNMQFVTTALHKDKYQFLFYSINALNKKMQFKMWLVIQSYIFLPIIIYIVFAAMIGFITHHYFLPFITILYVLLLVMLCTTSIVKMLNRLNNEDEISLFYRFAKRRKKSFFVLYTYYILTQSKVIYALTKLISAMIILGIFYNYPDLKSDTKISCLVVMLIIASHLVIIFGEQVFINKYLSFSYNFPYSVTKFFFGYVLNYMLILLPEILWMLIYFSFSNSCLLLLWAFSLLLLFRSLASVTAYRLVSFLKVIFLVLCLAYLVISYDFYFELPFIFLILSFIIFYKNHFYKELE
ncbi:MAG TPA: hypothetical protein VGB84_05585 [Arachidicoccus sp.]